MYKKFIYIMWIYILLLCHPIKALVLLDPSFSLASSLSIFPHAPYIPAYWTTVYVFKETLYILSWVFAYYTPFAWNICPSFAWFFPTFLQDLPRAPHQNLSYSAPSVPIILSTNKKFARLTNSILYSFIYLKIDMLQSSSSSSHVA